jgi:pimeloyl-[acyl-carrier protein] methyl ester esterase
MAYLDTENGGRVYYEYHRADGLPVVLIHGWGMSGDYWASSVAALVERGHGAIVIDHRACGRSDRDFDDLSIGAIAQDVAAIVEKCGVSRVVLNGWSLGGAVVVEAARRLGDKVAGLVLTCGASPRYTQADGFPHGGTAADVLGIGAAIVADRPGFFHTLAKSAAGGGASDALVGWLERGFIDSGARATETLACLATLDQRDLLASFNFPVLSIGGTSDTIADPAIAGFAASCARKGRLLMMETGHSPHLEQPTAYHEALLNFVETLA